MSKRLFDHLVEWELELFQRPSVGLNGQAILRSEADWINRYACDKLGKDHDVYAQAEMSFEDMTVQRWSDFPKQLYRVSHLEKGNLSKVCQVALDFLTWMGNGEPDLATQAKLAHGALAASKKELDRILRVYRYLKNRQKSWVYLPSPTEEAADIDWNQQTAELQAPDPAKIVDDAFRLITINRKRFTGYFKGLREDLSVLVQLDPTCCQQLSYGDVIPMKLYQTEAGRYFLYSIGYPILN